MKLNLSYIEFNLNILNGNIIIISYTVEVFRESKRPATPRSKSIISLLLIALVCRRPGQKVQPTYRFLVKLTFMYDNYSELVLYREKNGQSDSITVTNTGPIPLAYDNKMSSVLAKSGDWILFENLDFSGISWGVREGQSTNIPTGLNKKVSAVLSGTCIIPRSKLPKEGTLKKVHLRRYTEEGTLQKVH